MKREVYKFGGSSVRDARAIYRVAKLIVQNADVKVAVISATYNTTNRLEWVYAALEEGDEHKAITRLEEIKNHHFEIFAELCEILKLDQSTSNEWKARLKAETSIPYLHFKKEEGKLQTLDFLYSYGEWVSSWLVAFALNIFGLNKPIKWADARDVILTSDQAQMAEPLLDLMMTNSASVDWLHDDSLVVTQGFIGKTLDGVTTTLGREGSDYSATLIGRLLKASQVTIWTDVPGVASFDPRLIDEVLWHEYMSYAEAEFLATGGAKVLFPRTLSPIRELNIPVIVRSSLNHEAGKTIIAQQRLKGFAIAMDESNPTTISLLLNFPLDKKQFFENYGDALEIQDEGSIVQMKIPSSIALDTAKNIHQDLFAAFIG